MNVKFKRLDEGAKIPEYAHDGDAGMDFFSLESFTLEPGVPTEVRTGIAAEIDDGYVGLVWDRSSMAMKRGVKVMGGVVDSGYRGEWIIGLINLRSEPQHFEARSKIAQVLIQRVERADIAVVEELGDSHRGEKGFGSTGQ